MIIYNFSYFIFNLREYKITQFSYMNVIRMWFMRARVYVCIYVWVCVCINVIFLCKPSLIL